MKKLVYSYKIIFFCSISFCLSYIQASVQPMAWAAPVSMTRRGVASYFETVFNVKGYGSFCIEHLVDFLAYAPTIEQPLPFVMRITDLFAARIKEAIWTNPYAVLHLFKAITTHVTPLLRYAERDRMKEVKKSLYIALTDLVRFKHLRENPDAFVSALADEVIRVADNKELVSLQQRLVRLIESSLDRIIFSPVEQEQSWEVAKHIAHVLENLHDVGVIPDEATLQICYWTLVFRFIACIDAASEHFSVETYQLIKSDIAHGVSPLLRISDNSEGVAKQRAEWLKDAVVAGEVRARMAAATPASNFDF